MSAGSAKYLFSLLLFRCAFVRKCKRLGPLIDERDNIMPSCVIKVWIIEFRQCLVIRSILFQLHVDTTFRWRDYERYNSEGRSQFIGKFSRRFNKLSTGSDCVALQTVTLCESNIKLLDTRTLLVSCRTSCCFLRIAKLRSVNMTEQHYGLDRATEFRSLGQ